MGMNRKCVEIRIRQNMGEDQSYVSDRTGITAGGCAGGMDL